MKTRRVGLIVLAVGFALLFALVGVAQALPVSDASSSASLAP